MRYYDHPEEPPKAIVPSSVPRFEPVSSTHDMRPHESVTDRGARVARYLDEMPPAVLGAQGFGGFLDERERGCPIDNRAFDQHWRRIHYDSLAEIFTFEEIYKFTFSAVLMNDANNYMERHESLYWKVENVLYQCAHNKRWSSVVRFFDAVRSLRVDREDFDLRLVHTVGTSMQGYAHHRDLDSVYLDGPFALALLYRGRHVLTVGFRLVEDGIAVAQIQLREKKGNRWLYKLGCHYVDFCLAILERAFSEETLYLTTGESAFDAVASAYDPSIWDEMHQEDQDLRRRIVDLYNRPLVDFDRGGELHRLYRDYKRQYRRLSKKVSTAAEAAE